jgi:beta-glucosidase
MLGPKKPAVRVRRRQDKTLLALRRQTTYRFPDRFLWGASTSSHQVEGCDIHSDWWRFERQPGRVQNFTNFPRFAQEQKSGHWGAFEEDVVRMHQELGLTGYRFSIDWSRVEPAEGQFDRAAIEQYARMARLLRENGIRPFVTLFHWSSPDWIWNHARERESGWYDPRIVDRFRAFCQQIVPALAPHVDLFCTLNEPNIFLYGGFSEGILCPGHKVPDEELVGVMRNLCRAHLAAWHVIKGENPAAQVGCAHHFSPVEPQQGWNPIACLFAALVEQGFTWCFPDALRDGRFTFTTRSGRSFVEEIPGLAGTADFIGMNYYERFLCRVRWRGARLPFLEIVHDHHHEKAIWPKEINTRRFVDMLSRAWKRYKLPIYVTENGRSHPDDAQRLAFLKQHLAALGHAINDRRIDVRGYFWWSLLDNQEWAGGFLPRLGLYEVNYETGARRLRETGRHYAEVIRRASVTVD